MKTMGKIITGVLIISVIYMCIKNTKKTTQKEITTSDICIQTDISKDHLVSQGLLDTTNEENNFNVHKDEFEPTVIEEENNFNVHKDKFEPTVIEEENNTIDEYIQKEELCIEEVSNPMSQDSELKNMSVVDLKELAKHQQIKGYSRMKKVELIEILS